MSTASEHRLFLHRVTEAVVTHGYLTTPQLAQYAGLSISDEAMEKRLKRLRAGGTLEERRVLEVPCWTASRVTIRGSGGCLPYVKRIAATRARHALTTAQVAIDLQLAGHDVTTERELAFEEREQRSFAGTRLIETRHGDRTVFVMPDGTRLKRHTPEAFAGWYRAHTPPHRPDIRLDGSAANGLTTSTASAWEIELSGKSIPRLDAKLAWYAHSRAFGHVVYLCGTSTIARSIEQSAQRAAPMLPLTIAVLPATYLAASISRRTVVNRVTVVDLLARRRVAA